MINNRAFNFSSFRAFKGHHPELSLEQQIKNFDLKTFQKIKALRSKFKVDFYYLLCSYFEKSSPYCKCGHLKATHKCGFGQFRTACKECLKKIRVHNIRVGLYNNALEFAESIIDKVPVEPSIFKKIKSCSTGLGQKSKNHITWVDVVSKYMPKTSKKFLRESGLDMMCKPGMGNPALEHFLLTGTIVRCKTCGCATPMAKDYCKTCSVKTEERTEKIRKSHVANHGGLGFASKSIHDKATKTMRKRYGVTYSGESKELLAKTKATVIEKYGSTSPMDIPGYAEAFYARYADKAWVSDVVRKTQATKRRKWGKNWRSIEGDRLAKARYKIYEEPVGNRVLKVQGYEPYVIRQLIAKGCPSKEIQVYSRAYIYRKVDGKAASYRPDIFVDKYGLILEVKSTYTAGLGKTGAKMWKELQLKSKAVSKSGETLTLCVVFPKKGILTLEEPHKYSIKEAKEELLRNKHVFAFKDFNR